MPKSRTRTVSVKAEEPPERSVAVRSSNSMSAAGSYTSVDVLVWLADDTFVLRRQVPNPDFIPMKTGCMIQVSEMSVSREEAQDLADRMIIFLNDEALAKTRIVRNK